MRGAIAMALVGLTINTPVSAKVDSGDPDLFAHYFNAVPDVCFQTARGHPPTHENAAALLLEPVSEMPPAVKAGFTQVTSWFRLKSAPNNVFVGVGDRPNACHVVLANTTQAGEIQRKTIEMLKMGGFQPLKVPSPDDAIFVKQAPDGYMLVWVQIPGELLHNGEGSQGAINVNLMPPAMFESLTRKH